MFTRRYRQPSRFPDGQFATSLDSVCKTRSRHDDRNAAFPGKSLTINRATRFSRRTDHRNSRSCVSPRPAARSRHHAARGFGHPGPRRHLRASGRVLRLRLAIAGSKAWWSPPPPSYSAAGSHVPRGRRSHCDEFFGRRRMHRHCGVEIGLGRPSSSRCRPTWIISAALCRRCGSRARGCRPSTTSFINMRVSRPDSVAFIGRNVAL